MLTKNHKNGKVNKIQHMRCEMTDIEALKKRMNESGMKVVSIAEKSGILRKTLYNRLKTGDFKLSEICALVKTLGLSKEERDNIFNSKRENKGFLNQTIEISI